MNLRGWLLSLMVVIAMVAQASATTIVAIRTKDRIIMAADSLAQDPARGDKRSDYCKIRQTSKGIFAASGLTSLSWNNYDANSVIARAISQTPTLRAAVRRVEDDLQPFLTGSLRTLKAVKSPWVDVYLSQRAPMLSFIVCGFEKGVPVCIRREIFIQADEERWDLTFSGDECPGNCPADNNFMIISIGETGAIDKFLGQFRFIEIDHNGPDRIPVLLEQLVEMEIADKPKNVGPPVDIVEVTAGRIRWIKRKDACTALKK